MVAAVSCQAAVAIAAACLCCRLYSQSPCGRMALWESLSYLRNEREILTVRRVPRQSYIGGLPNILLEIPVARVLENGDSDCVNLHGAATANGSSLAKLAKPTPLISIRFS